jgi:5'-methylthioadenosine phosphorylase
MVHRYTTKNVSQPVDIAIIGGTGICDPHFLKDATTKKIYTPFGATSAPILIGKFEGISVAFLPRHETTHNIPPHLVPYQANLWALKELGVSRVLAPCSVGSLQPHLEMGDLVIPDQFFDWTKGRKYSYFNGGQVAHISMADPFCSELRNIAISSAKELALSYHPTGTTVTIEGPRFSTRAESLFFKNVLQADIIGMTLVPECVLARELEICYTSLAMITDYDAWKTQGDAVTHAGVEKIAKTNTEILKRLLRVMIKKIPKKRDACECHNALTHAMA